MKSSKWALAVLASAMAVYCYGALAADDTASFDASGAMSAADASASMAEARGGAGGGGDRGGAPQGGDHGGGFQGGGDRGGNPAPAPVRPDPRPEPQPVRPDPRPQPGPVGGGDRGGNRGGNPGRGGEIHPPIRIIGGRSPAPYWSHPGYVLPVFAFAWDRVRTITCTAVDSEGDQYPVTESDYVGAQYQAQIDNIENAAIDQCYDDTDGDTGCELLNCTPGY